MEESFRGWVVDGSQEWESVLFGRTLKVLQKENLCESIKRMNHDGSQLYILQASRVSDAAGGS